MIRARAGRADPRLVRLPIVAVVALVGLVVGCSSSPTGRPATSGPVGTPPPSVEASGTDEPAATLTSEGTPSPSVDATATPGETPGTSSDVAAGCTGSHNNLEFFRQAGTVMSWPVYCAVLADGWFLESGTYRLANGGRLEVTYRGPGDAHVSLVEGNVCEGSDVDTCAPRDSVVGPATFGDRDGTLGRLANGLVLDLDRGANPSWRATGLGLSEDDFRAICAAFLVVQG